MVYPGDFRVRRTETDEDGVVHEWDDELAGEAMPGGPVVLWDATANDPGINVVIHEFAHKLDMLNGEADGAAAARRMDRAAWAAGLREAYEGAATRSSAARRPGSIPTPPSTPRSSSRDQRGFSRTRPKPAGRYPDVYDQLAALPPGPAFPVIGASRRASPGSSTNVNSSA